jgi:hypothetical protein
MVATLVFSLAIRFVEDTLVLFNIVAVALNT